MSYRTWRILQLTGWTILTFVVMYVVLWASARHDDRLGTAMQKYEACVEREYGTTPSAWYAVHGELPECK
jgi:hypothetical protein